MVRQARPRYIAIFVLVAGLVAFAGASMTRAAFNTPDPIPGHVRTVGIDANPSGNTLTHVDSVDNSLVVSPGSTFTIDIVIDEVDPSDGISGFEGGLTYNWLNFHVVSIDSGSIIYSSPPSSPTSVIDSYTPDGFFSFFMGDFSTNYESGEGVLARITMKCDLSGSTSLDIQQDNGAPNLAIYDANVNQVIVDDDNNMPTVQCGTQSLTPTPICSPLPGDPDCDQHINPNDNCPNRWNYDQADADVDGVGDVCDNCSLWANASQALPSWPVPTGDADCDGFPNSVAASGKAPEPSIGTDPTKHCAATPGANNEPTPDAMPPDFNDDQIINGQDTGKYGGPAGAYNHTVGQGPFNGIPGTRFDFSGDGVINGQDTGKYQAYYNKTCA